MLKNLMKLKLSISVVLSENELKELYNIILNNNT